MPVPKSPVGCPMDSLLRLLMGPWTTYILWVLRSNGPTRFGELRRRVAGVSAKVLTERLRMLAESGVVHREHEPTIPPQVTYSLTDRGEELKLVLDQLNAIALSWRAADEAAIQTMPVVSRVGPAVNGKHEPAPAMAGPPTLD